MADILYIYDKVHEDLFDEAFLGATMKNYKPTDTEQWTEQRVLTSVSGALCGFQCNFTQLLP